MYNEENSDENDKEGIYEFKKESKFELTAREIRLLYFETEKNKSLLRKLIKNKYFIISTLVVILYYYVILYHCFHTIYESCLNFHFTRDTSGLFSSKVVIYFALYHIVLALFLVCFIKISIGNPGNLSEDYTNLYSVKNFYFIYKKFTRSLHDENKTKSYLDKITQWNNPFLNLNCFNFTANPIKSNLCRFCVTIKPERCNHCKSCRKCIRRKDHHCWVLNNCIGYGNYKIFLNLLFYLSLLCWMSAYIMVESAFLYDMSLIILLIACLATSAILLGLTFFYFLCYHIGLILEGVTQMEAMMKLKERDEEYYSLFESQTKLERLYSTLGSHIILWFIPFCKNCYLISAFNSNNEGYTYI